MPKQSRHEAAIRDRLNEIEAELAVKQKALDRLKDEKGMLEWLLKSAEGKEESDG